MPSHDYPYKNLVFEGGGVKGVACGGAFEVLEQRQITPQIESVAGTSAEARSADFDCFQRLPVAFSRLHV
jgi:predicted acylesterase/phospholipase RssA